MGAGVRPLTGDGQDLVAGRRLRRVCLTVTREPSKVRGMPWALPARAEKHLNLYHASAS